MEDLEKLFNLCYSNLKLNAPILSGNTQDSINSYLDNGYMICIEPKYYDLGKWEKTNQIQFTSDNSYAKYVNEKGGFGTRNRSMHWVNRALYDAVTTYASQIGAVVVNKLEL